MWNLLGDDIICSRNVQKFVNKLRNVDFTSFFKGHTYKEALCISALDVLQLLRIKLID